MSHRHTPIELLQRQARRGVWYDRAWTIGWLAIAAFFFYKGVQSYGASTPRVRHPVAATANQPDWIAKPIAHIAVGERVQAESPTGERDHSFGDDVDPDTWRKLTLWFPKEDGTWADVVLLRPLEWLDEQGAERGETIDLFLPEYDFDGEADVLSVEPCPTIQPGHGRIVTGTFRHSSSQVVDLRVTGQDKPIGTTASHPFWSEDRNEFVPAESLEPGERLRTLNGTTRVVSLSPRGSPEPVYNLEVQVDHVYHVTSSGILVHNMCATAAGMADAVSKGKVGELAAGITAPKKGVLGPISGKMRFPDDGAGAALREVKNVSRQGWTSQLKDYSAIAKSRGVDFELWIRSGTRLSSHLRAAVGRGDVVIRFIPGL